jgi:topoisomerase-4 subunit B
MKMMINLLQAALDIEDDMENLRYNNIVDCNGCRCRWNAHLLAIDYFQFFFPELIKDGHLYILQTPLSEYETRKKLFIVILMKNEK